MVENNEYFASNTIRKLSSKYDFVKVRIYLDQTHYYILSRFLISRVLTAARIDSFHAVRMALDLKKRLVDQCCLDLSQTDLELELFQLMREYGYGAENINFYKMLSRWHHQRIPLVILISKNHYITANHVLKDVDMLPSLLSERLNIPCILKTTMIHELYFLMNDKVPMPLNLLDFQYSQDSIMQLLKVDISKYISEGKSFLIEGPHIQSSLLNCIIDQLQKNNQDSYCGLMIPFLVTINNNEIIDAALSQNDSRFVHIQLSPNTSLSMCLDHIHDVLLQRMMNHMNDIINKSCIV